MHQLAGQSSCFVQFRPFFNFLVLHSYATVTYNVELSNTSILSICTWICIYFSRNDIDVEDIFVLLVIASIWASMLVEVLFIRLWEIKNYILSYLNFYCESWIVFCVRVHKKFGHNIMSSAQVIGHRTHEKFPP